MTIAVAEALLKVTDGRSRAFTTEDPEIENRFKEILIDSLKKWGRRYPDAGYGGRFMAWLLSDKRDPYNSYGNGSAMRVSAAGYVADDLETTIKVAAWTAEVTHNHHEGVKGAEAVAACIFMARTGCTKEEIKEYVERQVANKQVDVILSHTCPFKYEPREMFIKGIDECSVDTSTEKWLDTIEERLEYKHWYAGHYHTEKKIDKLSIMFESISEFTA
jgi:ADP-ribosylglycohydrolase